MGLTFYREVPPERVDPAERRAAAGAVSFARLELELPELRVRWFEQAAGLDFADCLAGLDWFEHHHAIGGLVLSGRPRELWLLIGRGPEQTARTALHEVMHAFQLHVMGAPGITDAEDAEWEQQARRYARDAAGIAETIGGIQT